MLLRGVAGFLLAVAVSGPAVADPVDPVLPPAPGQPWASTAPAAAAAPPAEAAAPLLDGGVVSSGPPGIAQTPDGRTLTVLAENEKQLPVAPLTTALSSRDWLVGATFVGSTTGEASGGTLEVGYQIGCGVEMNQIRLGGTEGTSVNTSSVTFPTQGAIDVRIRPGTVINAPVMTKEFKGAKTRVIVKDIHVRVDGCVGKSNLRSYAILTSSTPHTQDVVAYYGVPKVF